jgi:hypothetical protein
MDNKQGLWRLYSVHTGKVIVRDRLTAMSDSMIMYLDRFGRRK